ncbi:MAG: thioredoxin family protein [Candidatus Cloacimonetes bacterium]|jgi:thiol-disulfide isomerase/thioredoxin|nr:thioredoxin family protein [Candidatus Cloacimonadota bacterium]
MDFEKLKQDKFSFVYITTKSCNVCKVLQPKLRELAKKYRESKFHLIELDDKGEAAGFFMAFSVPTFLVYSEGQELIRTARHLNIEEIETKLNRYHQMIFS